MDERDKPQDEATQRVTILPDGEGHFGFLQHMRVRHAQLTHLAALPGGMASGRASALILARLPDRSYVMVETSLRLLFQANTVFLGEYGMEADGKSQAGLDAATKDRITAGIMLLLIREREGSEITVNIHELNAIMKDLAQTVEVQYAQTVEVQYAKDGQHITFRAKASD